MLSEFKYVEFFVSNAKQASHYYRSVFGFKGYAYSGPETGNEEFVSYVLKQNKIFFVLTTALSDEHPISKWVKKHGDGVSEIAFSSNAPNEDYNYAIENGAQSFYDYKEFKDLNGVYKTAAVKTYGEVIHSFIDSSQYSGIWKPGFIEYNPDPVPSNEVDLLLVDHIVGNVEDNKMDEWVDFYEKSFNFKPFIEFTEDDIATKYSALRSKVMKSDNNKIKLPINEPAKGLKKSQIQEYIDYNNGAGVQHIALLTSDIISTIAGLRANGAEFLDVPDTYYDELKNRVGVIDEDIQKLRELKILVDRDSDGYLLQLFTKPIQDRPTLFIEIIQRKGCQGFGKGNFMALFESIEREQKKRGNL
tara:strand:- start:1793 stop:2872 length:1080 start_codon:yes stop_codon:yes gene_type:complete